MPGVAGIVKTRPDPGLRDSLDAMLQAMAHRHDVRTEVTVAADGRVGLGLCDLGVLPGQGVVSGSGGGVAAVWGEVYGGTTAETLARAVPEADGTALAGLCGSFAAAGFDPGTNRLVLGSDKFGTRPLYWTALPDGLAFASEVKALLRVPGVDRAPDVRALADCFRFGFVLGDKTLVESVRLLPPGTLLEFRPGETPLLRPYWAADSVFRPRGKTGATPLLADAAAAFARAVERRLGELDRVGMSLSGGLDSRAILAAMGGRARGRPTYTLGLPGCEDQRLTARLAAAAGTRHEFLEIGEQDLADFEGLARTLVYLSDGLYHPHESTERKALQYFERAPFRIVLRGHAGELAKASLAYPVMVTPAVTGFSSAGQVLEYIHDRANLGIRDLDPDEVFSPEMAEAVRAGPRTSLEETASTVTRELEPADLCLYFYLREWVRRQVVASLAVFRAHVEVRLPYVDEAFLKTLLALPLEQRWAGELQVEVVKRYMPELVRIPNSNTGAPLDAGPIRLFVADKVNSLAKRLSLPGFRHYTEFDRWQRRYFRQAMEQILFGDERTLSRGWYRPKGLRKVFDLHVTGKRNYAHLLGTAVALELWHREFLDP